MRESTRAEARKRQTAIYSLYGAAIVATMVIGSWWMIRARANVLPAMQRRISDRAVTWRCPNDHTFKAQGRTARATCPQCQRKSDIAVTYVCPRDGRREALIRIVRQPDGSEKISEVSFRRGVWDPVGAVVACPECKRPLSPFVENPFRSSSSPKD